MQESAKFLGAEFVTADGEDVRVSYEGSKLVLRFTDIRDEGVQVEFSDTIAFKWQRADSLGPEDRDDCCYEILSSAWLAEHIRQNVVDTGSGHRHYKLCFNACGILEVLSVDMIRVRGQDRSANPNE